MTSSHEITSPTRGLIALDIDGTLTAIRDHIPSEVSEYLHMLYKEGWKLLFVTGRTYHWSVHLLSKLHFPYMLACHNGALLFEMPEKKVLSRRLLSRHDVILIENVLNRCNTSGVVYAGPEHKEKTFYFPSRIPQNRVSHLEGRRQVLKETWVELLSYEELPDIGYIAVRCSEKKEKALLRAQVIEDELGFPSPRMTDSFNPEYSVIQVTAKGATKGDALLTVEKLLHFPKPIIAAGDDFNDLALLQAAEIKIAMEDAPKELLALADVIAPSAKKNGIIEGLQKAIKIDTVK